MAIVYMVRTGSYLPRSKKFFDCRCQALQHIKKIVDMAVKGLSEYEISSCVQLIPIDNEKLPNYRTFFKESELQEPALEKNGKTFFDNSVESKI